ncbi:hypothetical protein ONZ43_g1038 [Nemania bipapillata]|uniref:Uncharacterized protein n=1 Tax=Nemania bipapillata TaxID=110536 RepID=A0ACC2J608_9PEZI|nr:hypothetical protein ONZ43_g1038 [Nemania bipapillata]
MITEKFTPEALISAPRRGPAIPNYDGTLALYTESTHIGGDDRNEFYLLNITTGVSSRILHDNQAYEPTWLGHSPFEPSIAGHIRAPVHGLKIKALGDGTLAFTVLGKTHGGRVYTSPLRPFHIQEDLQREPYAYTIWYSTLSRQDDTWRIAGDLYNALAATDLRIPQEAGLYEDPKSQYDLCEGGIIVAAYRDPSWGDTTNVYFIRVRSFSTGSVETPKKIMAQSDEYQAICTLPQFSPDVSLDPDVDPFVLSSASDYGSKFGLSPNQVSEIYFEGGGNYIVHAWIVKPRHFHENEKFPLAILVHDSLPSTTWLNSWNTKWNAAAWAEQGYVVVLPNITGSTGNVPGVDVDNAVIAGAGYGGYLMNLIQGHPLASRFKAMICHAGIFSTQSMALQSNSLKVNGRIGGLSLPGASMETLENCNPARPTLLQNWKIPMLVIHNEKDPLIPVSEGLAAYNNLRSQAIPSKFLTFTNEAHDVAKEENSLEWHHEVFAWINRFTSIPVSESVIAD